MNRLFISNAVQSSYPGYIGCGLVFRQWFEFIHARECIGPSQAGMVNPMYTHIGMQLSFQGPSRMIGHATRYFGIVGVGSSKMAGIRYDEGLGMTNCRAQLLQAHL